MGLVKKKISKRASLGSRWWRYKWSGPITFSPLLILAIITWVYIDTNNEFFSAWSCETIGGYFEDENPPADIPKYQDLKLELKDKVDVIWAECLESQKFIPK